jgi:hypothetical protein
MRMRAVDGLLIKAGVDHVMSTGTRVVPLEKQAVIGIRSSWPDVRRGITSPGFHAGVFRLGATAAPPSGRNQLAGIGLSCRVSVASDIASNE